MDARSHKQIARRARSTNRRARGLTLIEVLVVMTVMSVLLAMAGPSFHRTVEQSHADLAGANLNAVWNAQRFYWLEHHTYSTSITELQSLELLDSSLTGATARYSYGISSADDATFTAAATRTGSSRWAGSFTIDQMGTAGGFIQATGHPNITPGF